jgi:hypothetical protein
MSPRQLWIGALASVVFLIGTLVVGAYAMVTFARTGDYGGVVVLGGTFFAALVGNVCFLAHCVNRKEGARSHREILQATSTEWSTPVQHTVQALEAVS